MVFRVRCGEIQGALSRILNSETLSNAERLRSFLTYLLYKFQEHPDSVLKESVIGIECFGKGPDFDPQIDSSVRTAANRLRTKLEAYYQTEGKNDRIRIVVPIGSYTPHITRRYLVFRNSVRYWSALGLLLLAGCATAFFFFRSKSVAGGRLTPVRLTFEAGLAMSPAISRDGRFVIYAADDGTTGNLVLWRKDLPDNKKRQITEGTTDDYDPDISPDLSTIVFRSERDQGGIYALPAGGGGTVRLIAKYGRAPKFSPDGRWILYWEGEPYFKLSALYIVSTQGGPPRRLQARFYGARYGVWSPDSRHILFWGSDELEWDWWITSINDMPAVKTEAVRALRGLTVEGPSDWLGDQVIFSASDGATNLWALTIASGTWNAVGRPTRITYGAGTDVQAAATTSTIVFANQQSRTNVWEFPLNPDGTAAAEERRVTDYVAREHSPSVSNDRSHIVFSSDRSGDFDVWHRDLIKGTDASLRLGAAAAFAARISPDGKEVAYGLQGPHAWPIWALRLDSASKRMICTDCGVPRSWSADRQWLLYESKQNEPFSVGALNVSTGERAIIVSTTSETYPDHFSPDMKWFSFHGRNTNRTRAIFIAPFRGLYEVPPKDWIAVTDGTEMDREAVWSQDQEILYFLSERDGFRCIWAQRLGRDGHGTYRPVGLPWPVRHFHRARYSLLNVGSTGDVGLTVANNRITFSLTETTGSIWLASRASVVRSTD